MGKIGQCMDSFSVSFSGFSGYLWDASVSKRAFADLVYWKKSNRKVAEKIQALVNEICTSPYFGTGKPEPLKHELSGLYSRRLSCWNRIVYRVDEQAEVIEIISAKGLH